MSAGQLQLFLPCAGGVEPLLVAEVQRICSDAQPHVLRGGVLVEASWRDAMRLNLHSRLAQRVLIQLARAPYRHEQDIYAIASEVAWEIWFTPRQTIKVEITAQHSPLKSLNFAALTVKDAVADRFRAKQGARPSVDTHWPDVRLYAHLTNDRATLYIDTSGEPLFKRGWREDKGDAPLKETLAAAMLAASGWTPEQPLYDPCCGSGTIVIEAAQIAANMAPGMQRKFAFEKLLPYQSHVFEAIFDQARAAETVPQALIFGSDVSHRMVDFSQRNAERAGVAAFIKLRGGDALQRMPPCDTPGVMLLNPPYGERIGVGGFAGNAPERGADRRGPPLRAPVGRESAQMSDDDGSDFFAKLASHWKKNYTGWSAWLLTPDLKLPSRMRFKESRRVPMWNGPIECRLFRFDLMAGSARAAKAADGAGAAPATPPSQTP
ncbi:MAG: Ribosomal RNA large subunit methyltransferase L [Paracidovorax wautersii]|uniref:Ribosomal RNA large subunit methyltransferase L n=1 Tax=Paracidovorax wautersii TaxID=1177982 RepID=A0A7V8JRU5_9BURK|nr:MAG: Ribosomal RNA large subunit methyltransferase L [Paracidovorax wautersii]